MHRGRTCSWPSTQFPFFDRIKIESGCRFIVCALLIPWADYVSEVGEIQNEVTSAGWSEPAEQFINVERLNLPKTF
jgi:hypothetical protein